MRNWIRIEKYRKYHEAQKKFLNNACVKNKDDTAIVRELKKEFQEADISVSCYTIHTLNGDPAA